MASLSGFRPLSVEQLLEAVERLSPAEHRHVECRMSKELSYFDPTYSTADVTDH